MAFSSDGKRIVTGSHDNTAKIWDAQTGREILTVKGDTPDPRKGDTEIERVAFSPDGKRIVTISGGTTKVWDARTGRELLTLKKQILRVDAVAFSPDGRRIVTGTNPGAKVWDSWTGQELLALKGRENCVFPLLSLPTVSGS